METPTPGREDKVRSRQLAQVPAPTPMAVLNFYSWSLGLLQVNKKKKKIVFYHWHGVIQILEITQIVGFVVNYLHPMLLVYLDGFPPSKVLIG